MHGRATIAALSRNGMSEPGEALRDKRKPATQTDVDGRYDVAPSFADLLPWVEYLPDDPKCMLLGRRAIGCRVL